VVLAQALGLWLRAQRAYNELQVRSDQRAPIRKTNIVVAEPMPGDDPCTKNDLYAAFVERGLELLAGNGLLGAITSRTGFFLSSLQRWREEILLKETLDACLTTICDDPWFQP